LLTSYSCTFDLGSWKINRFRFVACSVLSRTGIFDEVVTSFRVPTPLGFSALWSRLV
jgi:hypothetical protein